MGLYDCTGKCRGRFSASVLQIQSRIYKKISGSMQDVFRLQNKERLTERVTEKITERVTEKITERTTERITEKITERITKRITRSLI